MPEVLDLDQPLDTNPFPDAPEARPHPVLGGMACALAVGGLLVGAAISTHSAPERTAASQLAHDYLSVPTHHPNSHPTHSRPRFSAEERQAYQEKSETNFRQAGNAIAVAATSYSTEVSSGSTRVNRVNKYTYTVSFNKKGRTSATVTYRLPRRALKGISLVDGINIRESRILATATHDQLPQSLETYTMGSGDKGRPRSTTIVYEAGRFSLTNNTAATRPDITARITKDAYNVVQFESNS